MEKTYKCKNGHKFKREEAANVTCPTCNEAAEVIKWTAGEDFNYSSKSSSKDIGVMDEIGSIFSEIKGKKK